MNLTQRPLESIHRFSFLNIPLELTEGAVRETVQPQEVTHDGSRDAVPGPVHGPHGDAGSAQAAFVHVRGDLTRQAQGEESPTDACEEGEIAQRSSSGSPGAGRHRPALKKMLPPETASTDPLRKL